MSKKDRRQKEALERKKEQHLEATPKTRGQVPAPGAIAALSLAMLLSSSANAAGTPGVTESAGAPDSNAKKKKNVPNVGQGPEKLTARTQDGEIPHDLDNDWVSSIAVPPRKTKPRKIQFLKGRGRDLLVAGRVVGNGALSPIPKSEFEDASSFDANAQDADDDDIQIRVDRTDLAQATSLFPEVSKSTVVEAQIPAAPATSVTPKRPAQCSQVSSLDEITPGFANRVVGAINKIEPQNTVKRPLDSEELRSTFKKLALGFLLVASMGSLGVAAAFFAPSIPILSGVSLVLMKLVSAISISVFVTGLLGAFGSYLGSRVYDAQKNINTAATGNQIPVGVLSQQEFLVAKLRSRGMSPEKIDQAIIRQKERERRKGLQNAGHEEWVKAGHEASHKKDKSSTFSEPGTVSEPDKPGEDDGYKFEKPR
jgi:hypothetical protein